MVHSRLSILEVCERGRGYGAAVLSLMMGVVYAADFAIGGDSASAMI